HDPGHDLLGGGGAALGEVLPRVLGGLALDHQDVHGAAVVDPPRYHDVERGQLELLIGRVDLPVAADERHPDGGHRAVEGKAGQGNRQSGRVNCRDVVGV